MHDAGLVDGAQALGDLTTNVTAQLLGDARELDAEVAEGLPLHVLHDDVRIRLSVEPIDVAVVGPDDVLVMDASPEPRLLEKAVEGVGVVLQILVEDLERHGPPGGNAGRLPGHLGHVHPAHAAAAEELEEQIGTELLAFHLGSEPGACPRHKAPPRAEHPGASPYLFTDLYSVPTARRAPGR